MLLARSAIPGSHKANWMMPRDRFTSIDLPQVQSVRHALACSGHSRWSRKICSSNSAALNIIYAADSLRALLHRHNNHVHVMFFISTGTYYMYWYMSTAVIVLPVIRGANQVNVLDE